MAELGLHRLLERRFHSPSAEATEALGAALAERLEPGWVIALCGELGAGKTCFARGVARGLGVREPVTSPTYTLMHSYEGRWPVHHLDAWMEGRGKAFLTDGGSEWLRTSGIALVEWAERVEPWLPLPRLEVLLQHRARDQRSIAIRVLAAGAEPAEPGGRLARALAALAIPEEVSER